MLEESITRAIRAEFDENIKGISWKEFVEQSVPYDFAEASCKRLLEDYISKKEVVEKIEELRAYYRTQKDKHLDKRLNGLALDDELCLKRLQMIEAKFIECGLLSQISQTKSQGQSEV